MLSSVSNASPSVAKEVEQLFKKVDGNRDGKITKDELAQALKSDSVDLGSGDQGAKVDAIFSLLDQGGKGYFTKQDATAGLENLALSESAQGSAEPARGGGGGGGGGGAAVTVVNPDPADTNQDGKVSMQEQLAYVLEQYQQSDSAQQSQSVTYA